MRYENIERGVFIDRPNRFIANVLINGKKEKCHVKNTGRCKELLIEGADVILQRNDSPTRTTSLDLIAVFKGETMINIDSQVPNKVVEESIETIFDNIEFVKREFVYGESRIDLYLESDGKKILIEVKGVTLEDNGVALFPDAPTERGLKHIKELENSIFEGYEPHIIFLVQMSGVEYFMPNYKMHMDFSLELMRASSNGVNIHAYDCTVKADSIEIRDKVEVRFDHSYSI